MLKGEEEEEEGGKKCALIDHRRWLSPMVINANILKVDLVGLAPKGE